VGLFGPLLRRRSWLQTGELRVPSLASTGKCEVSASSELSHTGWHGLILERARLPEFGYDAPPACHKHTFTRLNDPDELAQTVLQLTNSDAHHSYRVVLRSYTYDAF